MLIVQSSSFDVYRNLAIEEYLMEHVTDMGPVLFLWQSACAVVMGKNQNPWRECRLDLMEKEGVPLARRISGGGTVYHDAGNLNYCIIVDRNDYREDDAYRVVLDALRSFGIEAKKTGRSNLSVGGLKFSGNAFAFRKGRALHHGTLLLDADLVRLNRYLGSMFKGIDTHAIPSVPADVTNLELGVAEVSGALEKTFLSKYGGAGLLRWTEADLDEALLQGLRENHVSDAWRFGATPRFMLDYAGNHMEVVKGVVVRASGNSGLEDRQFADIAISLLCQVD